MDPGESLTVGALQKVFAKFTVQVKDENAKNFEKSQSALQKYGQELVMSITEVIEARVKPLQSAIDLHTEELDKLRLLVAQLEGKIDSLDKTIEHDSQKYHETNTSTYAAPANPTKLKINTMQSTTGAMVWKEVRQIAADNFPAGSFKMAGDPSKLGRNWELFF
eukprot:2855275-Karenia_brevis.AAC.1